MMVRDQGKGLLLTPGSSVANCVWMDTFFYDLFPPTHFTLNVTNTPNEVLNNS